MGYLYLNGCENISCTTLCLFGRGRILLDFSINHDRYSWSTLARLPYSPAATGLKQFPLLVSGQRIGKVLSVGSEAQFFD